MPSAKHIAVIDIGKTNAKLVLVDANTLREVALVTTSNHVINGAPYPHYDVERLWAFILSSLEDFHQEHGVNAISITTHGACGALLDKNGNLAAPILDYEYLGIEDSRAEYERVRPNFSETGSPRLPVGLNLGAQIYWQFETMPGLKDRTETIVMYPQYWAYRLTGVAANEVTSLGCHTDLWTPRKSEYSSMVEALGWRNKFAPVREANSVLGLLLKDVADKTGLRNDTPVYCGIHDSNASLYPYLLSHKGPFSVVSTGTWVIVMSVGGIEAKLDEERDTLINVNALGNQVPSARFMGGREFEILRDGSASDFAMEDIHTVLDKSIMLLPSVEASSGPFPGKAMQWTHDTTSLTAGTYSVAASFYLALMTLTCLDLVEAQGNIFVEGSFCKNEAYLFMLQAMIDGTVSRSKGTGTSQGAALLVMGTTQQAGSDPVGIPRDLRAPMKAYGEHWIRAVASNG